MTREGHDSTQFEWLDLQGLTQYAAVSERTLRAWIHDLTNPLPASRVRGKILVRKSEFDRWLEQHAVRTIDLDGIVEEIVEAVTDGS